MHIRDLISNTRRGDGSRGRMTPETARLLTTNPNRQSSDREPSEAATSGLNEMGINRKKRKTNQRACVTMDIRMRKNNWKGWMTSWSTPQTDTGAERGQTGSQTRRNEATRTGGKKASHRRERDERSCGRRGRHIDPSRSHGQRSASGPGGPPPLTHAFFRGSGAAQASGLFDPS